MTLYVEKVIENIVLIHYERTFAAFKQFEYYLKAIICQNQVIVMKELCGRLRQKEKYGNFYSRLTFP